MRRLPTSPQSTSDRSSQTPPHGEQGPQLSRSAREARWWGWLYSEQQQKLCHFNPSMTTVHTQWVEVRTFSWVPPRPPVPMTQRRMLRHNALEAWAHMQKTGWARCRPPVRQSICSQSSASKPQSLQCFCTPMTNVTVRDDAGQQLDR